MPEHFSITLAEITFRITALHPSTKEFCRAYLCEAEDDKTYLPVTVTPEDIASERRRSPENEIYTDAALETTALLRKTADTLLQHNILVIHGSAFSFNGKTILFAADSGTGKSTHVRFWRETFGAKVCIINDDKPLVRVTDEVRVFGSPWDGKHRRSTNTSAPLAAVCFLSRSKTNCVKPLSTQEGYAELFRYTYRPADTAGLVRVFTLLDKLCAKVSFYRTGCAYDVTSAGEIYEGIKGALGAENANAASLSPLSEARYIVPARRL